MPAQNDRPVYVIQRGRADADSVPPNMRLIFQERVYMDPDIYEHFKAARDLGVPIDELLNEFERIRRARGFNDATEALKRESHDDIESA